MAKKKKYPYKFVRPEQLDEYKAMDKEALVDALVRKNGDLESSVSAKKSSDFLKDAAKEISEFRKMNTTDELEAAMDEVQRLKDERDAEIQGDLDEIKDVRGGFDDAINANKEHIGVLLGLLSKTA